MQIGTGHSSRAEDVSEMLTLPFHIGGLGLSKPTDLLVEFSTSQKVSAPLIDLIYANKN